MLIGNLKLFVVLSCNFMFSSVSSVQSLDRLGRLGDMTDDSTEILFQSFLQEAIVSSSGLGRDVYSLMLSIQQVDLVLNLR